VTAPTHVLVMAKAPAPGRVKTRLCPPCTPEEAAAVATAALHDTLSAVRACGADRRIIALDGDPGPWVPEGFEVVAQVEGRFDERLAAAWTYAGGPGLQIGMDTPQLTTELIDESLATLTRGADAPDAVLGPARDGGWWAIGLHRPHAQAFRGVPMSTPGTGRAQARRLAELGLRCATLPTLRDMDSWEDAVAIAEAHPGLGTADAVARVSHRIGRR
jgi:rSAM/selenodomain-associated transferase 1